jgi:hypothetical protein
MRGAQIWFADGPAAPTQSQREDNSSRQFAIVEGKAWFVEQTAIHRAQQERPYEASVMPHSFLNAAVYTLSTHGWEIPDRLGALTLERDAPLESSMPTADAVLVRIGDQWLLGHQYGVDGYRFVATVFDNRWLYTLCPDSVPLPLALSTA